MSITINKPLTKIQAITKTSAVITFAEWSDRKHVSILLLFHQKYFRFKNSFNSWALPKIVIPPFLERCTKIVIPKCNTRLNVTSVMTESLHMNYITFLFFSSSTFHGFRKQVHCCLILRASLPRFCLDSAV